MLERILELSKYGDDTGIGVAVQEACHSTISPHTHQFYELVYVIDGFCLHETGVDDVTATDLLIEGDIFLIKPGRWHRYTGSHAVDIYNCLFSEKILESADGELMLLPGLCPESPYIKLHLDIANQKRVARLIKGILYDQTKRETGWQLKIKSQLCTLLVEYARTYESFSTARDNNSIYPNYVASALEIISSCFRDPELTVAGIAKRVGVTPDYLSRQFKILTGAGLQEYLRRFRFAKAAELLLGGISVGDTANAVGFTNICHFSREFRKELGVAPTQYVKQNS